MPYVPIRSLQKVHLRINTSGVVTKGIRYRISKIFTN